MSIRIHIADDHAVFRSGLKALVDQEADIEVVGESGNTFDTLSAIESTEIDVLLLDINMPGLPASGLMQEISAKHPDLRVLILTMHDEEYYLREFFKLGAKGFMVKTSTGHELVQAIRRIHQGFEYIDPAMSKHLISDYLGRPRKYAGHVESLTKREQEVCVLLALGHTNTDVAENLSISKRTVETHRAAIMAKLELKNRAELVQFALDHGLLKR